MDSITQNSKNTKRYLPHDIKPCFTSLTYIQIRYIKPKSSIDKSWNNRV